MASLLLQVGIALAVLAAVGAVARRFGQSVIPAYIVAGILVGPNEPRSLAGVPLTIVEPGEHVDLLAELGLVLLLFFLGLEFSLDRLVRHRSKLAAIGSIDLVINAGAGVALGLLFGLTGFQTLLIAGVVYISSSAVITKSLTDEGWLANPESEAILGTLVFEDIAIAVYLAVVVALLAGSGTLASVAVPLAAAAAFLLVLVGIAWYGTEFVSRFAAVRSDEQLLLHVVGLTVLVAGLALAVGVSEAVAAFFVGTAFSTTDHVERIEHVVGPARDFFAALFFFAIGLTVDLTALPAVAGLLAAAVVLTTASKLASGYLSGRQYGFETRRSIRVGIGLVPRGEFSLVIAALVAGTGVGGDVATFAVGYVLIMSIVGSLLIQYADAITDRVVDDRSTPTGL
jgi:CPA2 family monovalent cation:H+ antiporter-2